MYDVDDDFVRYAIVRMTLTLVLDIAHDDSHYHYDFDWTHVKHLMCYLAIVIAIAIAFVHRAPIYAPHKLLLMILAATVVVLMVVMIQMALCLVASYHNNLNTEHCLCLTHSQTIHVQCEHHFELYFVFHKMLPMDLGI